MNAVVHLTTVHSPFDVRIYHREACSLAQAGYDVTVVAPWEKSKLTCEGIRIIAVPMPRTRIERFLSTGAQIFRSALSTRAGIYHFHDPELIPWMLLLAKRDRHVIYDVHEFYSESASTKHWIPSYGRRSVSILAGLIEKGSAPRMAGIVAVNGTMEVLFKKRNPRTVVVANYPPQSFIDRCGDGGQKAPNLIVYSGKLSRERGYETVFDAMNLVRKRIPEAHCLVVGSINEAGIQAHYPSLLSRGGNSSGVRWKGMIDYQEIPRHLTMCSVCWIPFLPAWRFAHAEPVKLFEYMAAGRPIVASRLGYTASVIEECGCGILVPPSDPQAHADAICYLLVHPKEAGEMGRRGRKAVVERYNWASQAEKLLAFYDVVLSAS